MAAVNGRSSDWTKMRKRESEIYVPILLWRVVFPIDSHKPLDAEGWLCGSERLRTLSSGRHADSKGRGGGRRGGGSASDSGPRVRLDLFVWMGGGVLDLLSFFVCVNKKAGGWLRCVKA